MKLKVLSPVGDMQSLKAAVFCGADEVYLGVKDFNARNNIAGFDLQSLKVAVDYAHVFGVRVFLTVNILFSDNEMQSAVDLIVDAYNIGVDAFIVQDVGLASLVHTLYPEVELHASTQMGLHNLEGVKAVEKLGFKRVVLARETPLEEIKRIKQNSNVEIEYFAQGALCVSFSGNCYLSSYLCDASGNRGKCKQLCRLPYTLKFGNKKIKEGYLLSAKDFNMLNRLQELEDAGVDSIKIEGRARRPYYVGVATKIYRDAIDGKVYNEKELELAFNRGYTEGYFNGNSNIISKYQNHIGLEIGKVLKVNSGKKFNELFIQSDYNVTSKSTLKFFKNEIEIATLSAFDIKKIGDLFRITTTQKIPAGCTVNLISDFEKEQEMLQQTRKRNLDIEIIAKANQRMIAKCCINGEKIELIGSMCEEAKNQPITQEQILENFNKSEIFSSTITGEIENIFIPKQALNQFRRDFFDKVFKMLTDTKRENLIKKVIKNCKNTARTLENFEFTTKNDVIYTKNNVVYDPENYVKDVQAFIENCKNQNRTPILNLPNFALKQDVEYLKNIVENLKIKVVVNNAYALDFNTEKVIGGGMNVYNNYTANYYGCEYLSAEGENSVSMPYMTLRHCPMKEHLNATCSNCPYKEGYTYTMQNGKVLKLKRKKLSTCTFYLED